MTTQNKSKDPARQSDMQHGLYDGGGETGWQVSPYPFLAPMTSVPSATTWGSPTATKRALLLHGLTSSSHTWHRVASSLAAQGYFITAPNLIGHGLRVSTDYLISSIAQDLRPYLEASNYSLIIGHSLGALTVLALSAHLPSSYPTAIILLDPPFQASQETLSFFGNLFVDTCANPKQAEAYSVENPLWEREDSTCREFSTRLCAADAVRRIFDQNTPWDFVDLLGGMSDEWKVTILVADPAVVLICPIEFLHQFPHVRPVIVPGAGHWIQNDCPDVVVEEALKTVAELDKAIPLYEETLP